MAKPMPQHFQNDSIFWIEIDKIKPNPYQPRQEFSEEKLADLANSIRQYGVLQPLVATRSEVQTEDGGLSVTYELIAGERRLRAAKIAGLTQVPLTIRTGEESNRMKLELAIIENIQREDLNPIDRARAFQRLHDEFGFTHVEVGKKIGRSREYVSNSIRLLAMPEVVQDAVSTGKITEGHARPVMMLADRPEEQMTLFKEILHKKLTVREAENISRRIAQDRVRKRHHELTPEILAVERELTDSLGTRVQIEQKEVGGKVVIEYFSGEDLQSILDYFKERESKKENIIDRFVAGVVGTAEEKSDEAISPSEESVTEEKKQKEKEDDDSFSLKHFSI